MLDYGGGDTPQRHFLTCCACPAWINVLPTYASSLSSGDRRRLPLCGGFCCRWPIPSRRLNAAAQTRANKQWRLWPSVAPQSSGEAAMTCADCQQPLPKSRCSGAVQAATRCAAGCGGERRQRTEGAAGLTGHALQLCVGLDGTEEGGLQAYSTC